MTSLLTILTLIVICWAMAKYNKSDNLFWILLISLFAGMAGGALINKFEKSNDESNVNSKQVYNPTQVSPATSIDFYAQLGDAPAFTADPVVKELEIPARDSRINVVAPSKISGEIRGQPNYFHPHNKGGPGIPFDTS